MADEEKKTRSHRREAQDEAAQGSGEAAREVGGGQERRREAEGAQGAAAKAKPKRRHAEGARQARRRRPRPSLRASAARRRPAAKKPAAEKPASPRQRSRPPRRRRAAEREAPARPVVHARAKYVRSSARKARLVMDHVRGKLGRRKRERSCVTRPRGVARDVERLLELGSRQRREQPRPRRRRPVREGDLCRRGPDAAAFPAARARSRDAYPQAHEPPHRRPSSRSERSESADGQKIHPEGFGSATSTTGSPTGSTSASSPTTCSRTSRSASTSRASSAMPACRRSGSARTRTRSPSTSTPRARAS